MPFLVDDETFAPSDEGDIKVLSTRIATKKFPENIMIGWLATLQKQQKNQSMAKSAGLMTQEMNTRTNVEHGIDYNVIQYYYQNLHSSRRVLSDDKNLNHFIASTTPHVHQVYKNSIEKYSTGSRKNNQFNVGTFFNDITFASIPEVTAEHPSNYTLQKQEHLNLTPDEALQHFLNHLDFYYYESEPEIQIKIPAPNRSFKIYTVSVAATVVNSILTDITDLKLEVSHMNLPRDIASEALALQLAKVPAVPNIPDEPEENAENRDAIKAKREKLIAMKNDLLEKRDKAIKILFNSGASFELARQKLMQVYPEDHDIIKNSAAIHSRLQQEVNQDKLAEIEEEMSKEMKEIISIMRPKKSKFTKSKIDIARIAGMLLFNIEKDTAAGKTCITEKALLKLIQESVPSTQEITPEDNNTNFAESKPLRESIKKYCLLEQQRQHFQQLINTTQPVAASSAASSSYSSGKFKQIFMSRSSKHEKTNQESKHKNKEQRHNKSERKTKKAAKESPILLAEENEQSSSIKPNQ